MKHKSRIIISSVALAMLSLSFTNTFTKQAVQVSCRAEAHYVGEFFGGGIVFSVTKDANGTEHGLVASLKNLSEDAGWSENTRLETKANSKTDGAGNTTTILNSGASKKSAAGLCDKYAEGEFADWYLPAADQAKMLHTVSAELNKILSANTKAQKLEEGWYWTSTEEARGSALGCDFSSGEVSMSNKLRTGYVRAVRSF